MDSLTLKRHNAFQNENNRKAAHSLAHRSFKVQLYLRELEHPSTNLKIDFLNPENRSVQNVSLVSTFK